MHLSEYQCQQAACRPPRDWPASWNRHLQQCPECRKTVLIYRRLYGALTEAQHHLPPLPPQFARNCSERIFGSSSVPKDRSVERWLVGPLILLAALIGALTFPWQAPLWAETWALLKSLGASTGFAILNGLRLHGLLGMATAGGLFFLFSLDLYLGNRLLKARRQN